MNGRHGVFRGKVKAGPPKREDRRGRHSALYTTYMQSDAWKALRTQMIDTVGGLCERCDASEDTVTLEVHHLTYERLGREAIEDLQVLCPPCHVLADVERAAEATSDVEFRRLDGWATKVYGPDWMDYPGEIEAGDAFDAWLERHS